MKAGPGRDYAYVLLGLAGGEAFRGRLGPRSWSKSKPHHWPSAHPATPTSASPARDDCHTHPAPTVGDHDPI